MTKNAKKFAEFLLRFSVSSGAKVRQSCRSRQMLQNDYAIAKICDDTAENEPSKVWSSHSAHRGQPHPGVPNPIPPGDEGRDGQGPRRRHRRRGDRCEGLRAMFFLTPS